MYVDRVMKRQCKYKLQNCCSKNQDEKIAILKSLEELTSLYRPQQKNSSHLYRQESYLSFTEKQFDTQPPNRRNTEQDSTTYDAELVGPLRMGEGTRWSRRK
jgi:hypothetical protein